ncbi:MAG: hypothetical protein HY537_00865 [Deltaproteobacteria bacterium]|nr:hypothetical protein [Deltaproteobacteria bacterium]
MFGIVPSQKRKIRKISEDQTRDGRWLRDFTSRTESSWTIIEHWASERDFHLIDSRGKRRLYQQGNRGWAFLILADIRCEERHVSVVAWLQVGFLMRLLTVFSLPKQMGLHPNGFWGVRARRRACREMNALLVRFNQSEIYGSDRFHLADLDSTTFGIALGSLVIIAVCSSIAISRFEWRGGLLFTLTQSLGRSLGIALSAMAGWLALHHFFFVRRLGLLAAKIVSLIAGIGLLGFLSIFLFTRTSTELLEVRVTYHCVHHYEQMACKYALEQMPPKTRKQTFEKLLQLEQELSWSGEASRK